MISPYYNMRKYTKYAVFAIVFAFSLESLSCWGVPYSEGAGYMSEIPELDFDVRNEKNENFSVKNLQGNVVIIVLFTLWCHNCPDVLQSIDGLQETLLSKGVSNVKIIPLDVGSDTINAVKNHFKAYNIQLLDVYFPIDWRNIRNINGVPACVVLDKKGNAVWGYLGGGVDYNSDKFVSFIKECAEE